MATSTLAPVTSLRPELWTWMAARWMTRWKAAVGTASDPSTSVISVERSSSMKSVSIRRSSFRSTLQARMTRTASGSSVKASSRCSSVASSWRWRFASDKAEWIACSRVVEKDGTALLLSVDWRSGAREDPT